MALELQYWTLEVHRIEGDQRDGYSTRQGRGCLEYFLLRERGLSFRSKGCRFPRLLSGNSGEEVPVPTTERERGKAGQSGADPYLHARTSESPRHCS